MKEYCKGILNDLLDKYGRSVLSKQGSDRNISIRVLSSSKLFDPYKNYKTAQEFEQGLSEIAHAGYVTIQKDRNENIISVSLCVAMVDEIYKATNRPNPLHKLIRVSEYFSNANRTGIAKLFIDDEYAYINKTHKIHQSVYSDLNDLENLVKCITAVSELYSEIMERDFSVRVFGDSKIFAALYKSRVVNVFRKYVIEYSDLTDDEILSELNIAKNTTYVIIKNCLTFRLHEQIIDLDKLGYEFSLSDEMIKGMQFISTSAKRLITVENLTSFRMLNDSEAIVVFLSGFHNHTKQMLLKKIYSCYPSLEYYHYGDIDAGGFYILQHLRTMTDIPFQPYCMDTATIKKYLSFTKPLTDNDRTRLEKLLDTEFHDTVMFMLENNCKLEQENLD